VVSNQSGVARGLIGPAALEAVNARVEELLGVFDTWAVCPHDERDRCACRKPAPGLVLRAAAGARGILVPTAATARSEVEAARETARDLAAAVDMALLTRTVDQGKEGERR
jgi:D-glycero-D-manno-heptose 1,7-bisphosphate phosphatase